MVACSFCDKPASAVKKVVARTETGIYICNECIWTADDMLRDKIGGGPVTRPPAETIGLADITKMASKFPKPDRHMFILTFLHMREVDRHLSDLNHMRKDIDWLKSSLSKHTKEARLHSGTWTAALRWLEEETARHCKAVDQLRGDIAVCRVSRPKMYAEIERVVRPTFGKWLIIAG